MQKPVLVSLVAVVCSGATIPQAAPSQATPSETRRVSIPKHQTCHKLRPDLYGYSIEPSSTYAYTQSAIAANILAALSRIIGHAPPIRIGGTTADEISVVPSVNSTSHYNSSDEGSSGGNNGPASIALDTKWYDTWKDYFPNGTQFTYTLNFRNETNNWESAQKEATAALNALGPKLTRLEMGNEVDHYISKGWRKQGWNTTEYAAQWTSLRTTLQSLPAYKAQARAPKFQAAVFADPPAVPDQQDELDDFDITNLTTHAGLTNADGSLSSYAVHLYPQSNCDAPRRARLSLTTLSNHTVLHTNLSQYIPAQRAASSAGAPLILGETNSASCGGASGVSDVFAAALWAVDYALLAPALGTAQLAFHLGEQSEYSAFTPAPYAYKNESLAAGVRATAYAHLFVAHALANLTHASVAALPDANASDFSGYAIRAGESGRLRKLVFLDMGVWNSSAGVADPSTLRATDSSYVSAGTRPVRSLEVRTPWAEGAVVGVLRLLAPGSNAKSLVSVSGLGFETGSGELVGQVARETVVVGPGGLVCVEQRKAEGVLLSVE